MTEPVFSPRPELNLSAYQPALREQHPSPNHIQEKAQSHLKEAGLAIDPRAKAKATGKGRTNEGTQWEQGHGGEQIQGWNMENVGVYVIICIGLCVYMCDVCMNRC